MKNNIKVSVLTVLLIGLTVDVSAQQVNRMQDKAKGDQQGQMMNRADRQGQNHRHMMTQLNLTNEQKEKIGEIRLNGQKGMIPLRNNMQEKNAQLRTLKMSYDYDEAAVNALIEEIGELRTAMMTMRTARQQEVREVLDEGQRIKFDTMIQFLGAKQQGSRMNHKNRKG
ncbi:MAG TPA: Spy/CpxP family protein refolding chaperone [Gracilimonas sp.]|uniref:Spy/CpxP family protein refolding chaperone n=1 Tax=Gracilimonas sp. TaxID=1974203 RepID=UPI002DA460E1|nr:Spy/CpxP family protein refolding chaperone [Gracilimonas sp.]